MTDDSKLYVPAEPAQVITADAWNEMQELIYDDIRAASQQAAESLERVDRAGDAEKLDGQTPDELIEAIIARILDQLRDQRGYLKAFRVLDVGTPAEIRHGFGNCPVVDVYQLDYFRVVCSEDDMVGPAWTTFYLYHSSEKKIRYAAAEDGSYPKGMVEIEPKSGPIYKVPFRTLLQKYGVEYDGGTSLGDLETEFWRAFFGAPENDEFDDDQYCHSPWFHRCCREEKSVRALKKSGDWDELLLAVQPRKTVNVPGGRIDDEIAPAKWTFPVEQRDEIGRGMAPTQIEVCQLDLDTVRLRLTDTPIYPVDLLEGATDLNGNRTGGLVEQFGEGVQNELKIMVLLKC